MQDERYGPRDYRATPPERQSSSNGCLIVLLIIVIVLGLGLGTAMWSTGSANGPQVIPWLLDHLFGNPGNAHAQPSHSQYNATIQVGSVVGGPTLSPAFLNQVLALTHSPAQGTGQALYDLSQHYQIDDAAALGFFKVESEYGTTGVARQTRSLGNIRCPFQTCYQGYRSYASYQAGYEDWFKLIRNQYVNQWHETTLSQIVPVYAPVSDGNNPPAYIATVKQMEGQWWNGKVVV